MKKLILTIIFIILWLRLLNQDSNLKFRQEIKLIENTINWVSNPNIKLEMQSRKQKLINLHYGNFELTR